MEDMDLEDIEVADIDGAEEVADIEVEEIADIDEDVEEADENHRQRLPKRYVRNFENPFERFREEEFKVRFRFSKDVVSQGLLPEIRDALTKPNQRGLPIEPCLQLLIALRFYATGSFQAVYGDLCHVSIATVSRIVFRISRLFAAMLGDVIKMPTTPAAIAENRRLFQQLGTTGDSAGLPGVDGAIDCTHVRLVSTKFEQYQEVFRNRKGYFSLNVQAVVGPRMEFIDFVPEWPGSTHDSRIFQNSRIHMRYRERELDGLLLGDSGYALTPFMMTPVRNPANRAEEKYNYVHSRTRMVVERTFGVWKRRFPCLSRGLANKLICSTTIVTACAVLHNLSLRFNEVLPEDEFEPEEEENDDVVNEGRHWEAGEGGAVRRAIIQRLY